MTSKQGVRKKKKQSGGSEEGLKEANTALVEKEKEKEEKARKGKV